MTSIQILGPFNSGTNLITKLLQNNCKFNDKIINIGYQGHTKIWKHTFNINEIKDISDDNTFFVIMYRHPYLWINSNFKISYEIKGLDNVRSNITLRDDKYNNIVELYNFYYNMYIELIKNNKNVIWLDYSKIVDKNESFGYISSKLSEKNIKLNSNQILQFWLSRPCKGDGNPVRNSDQALHRCNNKESLFNEADKQFINEHLDSNIIDFFESK